MIKSFDLFNPYPNKEVTTLYCKIITDSLATNGFCIKPIDKIVNNNNETKGIIVVTLRDAVRAKKANYGFVITWIQGIEPEEYWLNHKDVLRLFYYSIRERIALRSSDFLLYCSETMKKHYERKYLFKTKNYYIMPCFNDVINETTVFSEKNNTFAYVGSLEKWQCYERTVKLYKTIERSISDAKLCVYTKDKTAALQMLLKYEIKNYEIEYINSLDLANELKKAKFGFCIRDDIEVNRVATPTKLSNYVSLGIVPLYSKCLNSFYSKSKDNPYCICVDDSNWIDQVKSLAKAGLCYDNVMKSFFATYKDYYSRDYHVKKLSRVLYKLLIQ